MQTIIFGDFEIYAIQDKVTKTLLKGRNNDSGYNYLFPEER